MKESVVNEHQPSITEWFAAIGEEKEASTFREEDNRKAERLEELFQVIRLPYERPDKFSARAVWENSKEWQEVLAKRGNELCALRVVPHREGLPKLRNRGMTIKDAYKTWFLKLEFDPDQYDVFLCPHCDELLWSSIFVVKKEIIFGEFVRGQHNQLTQGNTKEEPYRFQFDFQTWKWSASNLEAQKLAQETIGLLKVPKSKQNQLQEKIQASFVHDYLQGYFETTVWPGEKIYYIDYNRILPRYIPVPPPITKLTGNLRGMSAFPGQVTGRVVIMKPEEISTKEFLEGSVLICDNTDVRYLPIMRKAAAIITQRGGVLSHAAIIARELKKPCIVGCQGILALKDGDQIELNATTGVVRIVP